MLKWKHQSKEILLFWNHEIHPVCMYNSRQLLGLMDKNIDSRLCVYKVCPTKNCLISREWKGSIVRDCHKTSSWFQKIYTEKTLSWCKLQVLLYSYRFNSGNFTDLCHSLSIGTIFNNEDLPSISWCCSCKNSLHCISSTPLK